MKTTQEESALTDGQTGSLTKTEKQLNRTTNTNMFSRVWYPKSLVEAQWVEL